jgi:hypothetical protein
MKLFFLLYSALLVSGAVANGTPFTTTSLTSGEFTSGELGTSSDDTSDEDICRPWYLKYWKGTYLGSSGKPWKKAPITVLDQQYTPNVGGTVSFKIDDNTLFTWTTLKVKYIFVEYYDPQTGFKTCNYEHPFGSIWSGGGDIVLTAGCMQNAPVSPVTITVVDDFTVTLASGDNPKPPQCCNGQEDFNINYDGNGFCTDKVVEYVVVLRCDPDACDDPDWASQY